MKVLSYFLLALTFSNLTWATVEYGTLDVAGGNTSLVLNEGDVFEVTNFENKFSPSTLLINLVNFTAPDGTARSMNFAMYRYSNKNDILALPNPDNMVIYGPTNITLGIVDWLMYKLTRASNPQPATAATTEN